MLAPGGEGFRSLLSKDIAGPPGAHPITCAALTTGSFGAVAV